METAQLEQEGAKPLAGELDRIAKLNSREDLVAELGSLHLGGTSAVFNFSIEQDEKQSSRYAAYLTQGGQGLPERGYYLGTSADSKKIRDEYREHVDKMLELLGDSK